MLMVWEWNIMIVIVLTIAGFAVVLMMVVGKSKKILQFMMMVWNNVVHNHQHERK